MIILPGPWPAPTSTTRIRQWTFSQSPPSPPHPFSSSPPHLLAKAWQHSNKLSLARALSLTHEERECARARAREREQYTRARTHTHTPALAVASKVLEDLQLWRLQSARLRLCMPEVRTLGGEGRAGQNAQFAGTGQRADSVHLVEKRQQRPRNSTSKE